MKQNRKRAIKPVYAQKHDLPIVIIIPFFFRGFLSSHPHPPPTKKHKKKKKNLTKKKKKKKIQKKIEMKMKQHWKRAVQHVYVPKHDLRIVIIIPLFFRGCLSESPPRTDYRFTLLQITTPRSRPFRGPGIVDCSRIQVNLLRFIRPLTNDFFLSSACLEISDSRDETFQKSKKWETKVDDQFHKVISYVISHRYIT